MAFTLLNWQEFDICFQEETCDINKAWTHPFPVVSLCRHLHVLGALLSSFSLVLAGGGDTPCPTVGVQWCTGMATYVMSQML